MAKYNPFKRVVGKPITIATKAATIPPIKIAIGIGNSAFRVSKAPT